MAEPRREPGPLIAGILVLSGLVVGCATVRTGQAPGAATMNRVDLARCIHVEPGQPAAADLTALAGSYTLHVFDGSGANSIQGQLVLQLPGTPGEAAPLSGPPPLLIGNTDVSAEDVGAIVPGDAGSMDPAAPGAALYRSEGDLPRLRLGAEANRRDRTRFDGAHTTLTILSIGEASFGGDWTSAEGAVSVSGQFCARRTAS